MIDKANMTPGPAAHRALSPALVVILAGAQRISAPAVRPAIDQNDRRDPSDPSSFGFGLLSAGHSPQHVDLDIVLRGCVNLNLTAQYLRLHSWDCGAMCGVECYECTFSNLIKEFC